MMLSLPHKIVKALKSKLINYKADKIMSSQFVEDLELMGSIIISSYLNNN